MIGPVQPSDGTIGPLRPDPLKETSRELERAFVQEMLKHAGLAEAFTGRGGEGAADAFSGFLLEAVAERVVEGGGFGLADRFYRQLAGAEGTSAGFKA